MKISTLQKGLILHLPLDKESLQSANAFADKTPYSNNGISVNTPVFTTDRMGQANRAMSFNGTSDYVDCGNDESLNFTEELTVSFWMKATTIDSWVWFVVKNKDSRASEGFFIARNSDGTIEFTVNVKKASVTFSPTIGTWYHIVGVFSSDDYLRLYINNNLVASADVTPSAIIPYDDNLTIGRTLYYDSPYFNGSIADVRIYNRALTTDEINSLYETYRHKLSAGSLQKGLVLDMPLNTTYMKSDVILTDRTPYSNDGTNSGAEIDTDHATFVAANNDYIRIADDNSLDIVSTMSVFVWVKWSSGYWRGIITKWDQDALKQSFLLGNGTISPYNRFRVDLSDDGTLDSGHRKRYESSIVVNDNVWHLIGFTFNAGTLKLYIDGIEDPNPDIRENAPITTIFTSDRDVMIGSFLDNNIPAGFFNGDIAKPRIYNRVLSDREWLLYYDQTKGLYI